MFASEIVIISNVCNTSLFTGIAQRYHKLLTVGVATIMITIAVKQNSAIAQQPTKTMTNITKVISGYPFVLVLYHGPTLLVLRGDMFSTSILAAVDCKAEWGDTRWMECLHIHIRLEMLLRATVLSEIETTKLKQSQCENKRER